MPQYSTDPVLDIEKTRIFNSMARFLFMIVTTCMVTAWLQNGCLSWLFMNVYDYTEVAPVNLAEKKTNIWPLCGRTSAMGHNWHIFFLHGSAYSNT